MFGLFEKLVSPYPDAPLPQLPRGFFAFIWACARGTRRYIGAMTFFTAVIGAFEALLFSMLGHVVDWLAKIQPSRLFADERTHLLLLGAIGLIELALLLVALHEEPHLGGESHAGLSLIEAVEEGIVIRLDDAAGVEGLRQDSRQSGFSGPDGAFDGDKAGLFEEIGHWSE